MSPADKQRAEGRFAKSEKTSAEKAAFNEREAAAKAVRDNMAKLKELRLAREAANPAPQPAKSSRTKSAKTAKSGASGDKKTAPALSEWLAGQQSGGRRT
jgi:hypothetical protein